MTALCSGGTSSQNPGLGEDIALTTSALAALLNNIPTLWAVPFAAALGLLSYHLSTFCATDPPGYPTFTASDFAALLSLNDFDAFLAAQRKLRDLVDTAVWYQSCHCDTVATPAPPTAPTQPTGMPTINPVAVAPTFPTGTPCQTEHFSGNQASSSGASSFTPIAGGTTVRATFTASVTALTSNQFGFDVAAYDATFVRIATIAIVGITTSGVVGPVTAAIPASAVYLGVFYGPTSTPTPAFTWDALVEVYCGTTPTSGGGPVPTPCQTDPSIQLVLSQILQLLTLVQRNAVPFAYVGGASHTGLTGAGVLTIPSLQGVKITLTTQPTYIGEEFGDPLELFEVGWFAWGTTDGYLGRELISHNPQLSFPAKAEQYTRLGYSLNPGVVATIQELYAET